MPPCSKLLLLLTNRTFGLLVMTLQGPERFLEGAMNSRRAVLALLLIVFVIRSADAQIFGTVRGTIVDPQGAAISGAKVTLESACVGFQQNDSKQRGR